MNTTLSNKYLSVEFSSLGGEITSIKDTNGKEYLWQGDPAFWSGRAPILFPNVGRLTDGKYTLDGNTYEMKNHGFWRNFNIDVYETSDDSITFLLKANDETKKIYPRDFTAKLTYLLKDSTISINFNVVNTDSKPMYFAYGGHPGFFLPIEDNLKFEDYQLVFSQPCKPTHMGVSSSGFVDGNDVAFPLKDNISLDMHHSLFDNDSIALKNVAPQVTLKSAKGGASITVDYPDMEYLVIWHPPLTEAPFLCIEPWTSLPARKNLIEKFEDKEDLVTLEPNKEWNNNWSITINK